MKKMDKDLFAVYRNGQHKGNTKGYTMNDAIKNYVIESELKFCLNDREFILQYSAIEAIEGIHYNETVL
jgi:hypothetical protein